MEGLLGSGDGIGREEGAEGEREREREKLPTYEEVATAVAFPQRVARRMEIGSPRVRGSVETLPRYVERM